MENGRNVADDRFDELTREIGAGAPRRRILQGLGGITLGLFGLSGAGMFGEDAEAKNKCKKCKRRCRDRNKNKNKNKNCKHKCRNKCDKN